MTDPLKTARAIAERKAEEVVDNCINGRKKVTWEEMIDQMIQEDKEVIIGNMREDMLKIRGR